MKDQASWIQWIGHTYIGPRNQVSLPKWQNKQLGRITEVRNSLASVWVYVTSLAWCMAIFFKFELNNVEHKQKFWYVRRSSLRLDAQTWPIWCIAYTTWCYVARYRRMIKKTNPMWKIEDRRFLSYVGEDLLAWAFSTRNLANKLPMEIRASAWHVAWKSQDIVVLSWPCCDSHR